MSEPRLRLKRIGQEVYIENWRSLEAEQLAALEADGLIVADNRAHRSHGLAAKLTWAGRKRFSPA